MPRLFLLATLGVACAWWCPGPGVRADEATPKSVKDRLDAADQALSEGMPKRAASELAAAAKGIEELAMQGKPPSGLRLLWERCRSLRSDVELEGMDVSGIVLAPLKSPGPKPAEPPGRKPTPGAPNMPQRENPPPAKAALTFTGQVAPILTRHCGGCHVAGRKGGFQMTSYAGLMKTGVVQPGVGQASRLVEVILSGDMPRGGGKVSPEEVGMLIKWIDSGAPFDGPDPTAPLENGPRPATAAPPAAAPVMAVQLKPGDVSFAADVAPILLEQCAGCHDENRPEGNLSMFTPERLMRGGRGGAAIMAGKGGDSLLVKKLKGTGIEGQRMPLGKKPLADETVTMIQKWIDQGARFDLLGPKAQLETIVAAGRSKKLSHEDLRQVRFRAGETLWSLAIPDEKPRVADRGDIRVIGNLSAARIDELADEAASAEGRLRREMTGGGPVVKGGIVVFVFAKAYDLSGFWQTVFSEERPKTATNAAGVTGDVVFAALVVPSGDGDDATSDRRGVLTEQIGTAALLARATPSWFARGAGRALATKAEPKAPVVQAWRRELPAATQKVGSVSNFLAGNGDPAAAAVVAGGFVSAIMPSSSRLEQLVGQLDGGTGFEPAFTTIFRGSPTKLFEAWAAQGTKSPRR